MAKLTLYGPDKYIELRDQNSPNMSLTRKERNITRHVHLECADETTFDEINATIQNELFPPFGPPGRFPVPGSIFFVKSAKITPVGKASGTQQYGVGTSKVWRIDVVYGPLPYETEEDQGDPLAANLTRNWAGSGEYMTLPGTSIYWEGDEKPAGDEGVPSTIRLPMTQHSHTRENMPTNAIPYSAMRAAAGRVNKTDFPDNHPIFPGIKAGQLLVEDWDINFTWASDGQKQYAVTLNFKERTGEITVRTDESTDAKQPFTWHHVWDKKPYGSGNNKAPRGWRKVYRDKKPESGNQSKPLYEEIEIAKIEAMFR